MQQGTSTRQAGGREGPPEGEDAESLPPSHTHSKEVYPLDDNVRW